MNSRFASCLCAVLLSFSLLRGATEKDADLASIATETSLILGGSYAKHLDYLESVFRGDAIAMPREERERCLLVIAALKRDIPKHIDIANNISESINSYVKCELVAQAFGMHVILAQCAYSAAVMEQAIIEAAQDSQWRLEFKRNKADVHQNLMNQQQKCFSYAFGIL